MKKLHGFLTFVMLLSAFAGDLHAEGDYTTPYTFGGLAGPIPVVADGADGVGSAARFNSPRGAVVGANGNVYVADSVNHTIRQITPAGVVSTFAGKVGLRGTADGSGGDARFNNPQGLAADAYGNIYVADAYNHTIRKITSEGSVTTLAGVAGNQGFGNGAAATARFALPWGVTVDANGNVYVADSGNHVIRKISGGTVTTWAGSQGQAGSSNGVGGDARFFSPCGVAADGVGNVYVADRDNNVIRKITAAAEVSTYAGLAGTYGSADGTGEDARFFRPEGVAVDTDGVVLVADTSNNTIRTITADRVVTTLAGTANVFGHVDGIGAEASFQQPVALAADGSGNIYVADRLHSLVRKITAEAVVTTLAGAPQGITYGSTNGTGADARFRQAYGVAIAENGTVYVADTNNQAIRKITTSGVVTTLAGTALSTGAVNGTGADARFNNPYGIAVDGTGTVYVADTGNFAIRKITDAGVVTTLAGVLGVAGGDDGAGGDAKFMRPYGITYGRDGYLYVADESTVRKVTLDGVVTTLAGVAGVAGSANGTGSDARFSLAMGIAADADGVIYVTDVPLGRIRKITPEGVVTTLAGQLSSGYADGAVATARFSNPWGIAVDGVGNLYVADDNNHVIRKITHEGDVITLAGAAGGIGMADGTGVDARFYNPRGIASTLSGQLVVTDSGNYRIVSAAPYVTSADMAAGTAGDEFSFAITGIGLVDSYGATGLPSGLTVNTVTGAIGGRPMVAGVFDVEVSATNVYGQAGSRVVVLTVETGDQEIAFDALGNKILGDAPFVVQATASSGLAVNYTIVSGPATVDGSTVTLTGTGTVVVRASQPGNDSFYAAEPVERSFTVTAPTVILGNLSATYDGTSKAATATTVPEGLNVEFTYNGSATVPKDAGSYTVVGTINDGDYVGSATGTLVISKAVLLVTVDAVGFIGKSSFPISLTYGGFVAGDDASVLDKAPAAKTKATLKSQPGVYAVTPNGGSDNNYTIISATGQIRLVSYEGAYEAMLKETEEGAWSGKVELTMGTGPGFTGKLWVGEQGVPMVLRGSFGFSGASTTALAVVQATGVDATVYTVELALPENGALAVVIKKGAEVVASSESGTRLWMPEKRPKVSWAGACTLLLRDAGPLDEDDSRAYPAGAGYASAKLSTAGVMTVTGALADGTKLTATLNPDSGTTPGYRLFAQPYLSRAGSYLAASMRLIAHPNRAGLVYLPESSGQDVYWSKAARGTDANYRAGFGPLGLTMTIDPWTVPTKKAPLARSLSLGDGNGIGVTYHGVDRVADEPALPADIVLLNGTTPVVVGSNGLQWAIKINATSGTYTGSFVLGDDIEVGGITATVRRTVPFAGAFRQTGDEVIGSGYFLLPAFPSAETNETVSGEIRFTRP